MHHFHFLVRIDLELWEPRALPRWVLFAQVPDWPVFSTGPPWVRECSCHRAHSK